MDRLRIAKNFGNLLEKRYPEIVRVVLFRQASGGKDPEEQDISLLVVSERDSLMLKRKVMKDAVSMLMRTGVSFSVRTISMDAYDRLAKTCFVLDAGKASLLVG